MGSHLVLLVTTFAIGVDTWCLVPIHYFKQRFSCEGLVASWNTIGRDNIDPDDLVVDLDATIWS